VRNMENASQCGAWLPLGRMRIATIGSRFCLGEGGGFVSRLVLLARLLAHGSSLAGASKRASRVSRKSDLGRARRLADELAAHEGLRGDLPEAVAVMGWTLRVRMNGEGPLIGGAPSPRFRSGGCQEATVGLSAPLRYGTGNPRMRVLQDPAGAFTTLARLSPDSA
jgi:hypothetical protein